MKVERVRPQVLRLTLHAYELAALVAAARWAAEKGELPTESVEQLRQVLANYDEAARRNKEGANQTGSLFPENRFTEKHTRRGNERP